MSLITWYSDTKYCHFHNQYKDRVSICDNGSICLNTVRLPDSGLYQIKIVSSSGALKPPKDSDFHLQVFEPVSCPNITVECLRNTISLSCSSSQGSEVTYSWETLLPSGNNSCVQLGQTIEINSFLSSESISYTCTAQNPVSRATSDPVELGICSVQGGKVSRWVIVLCASLLALLLIGALICLYKRKKTNRGQRETNQAEIEHSVTEEEPSPAPLIEPVYVTQPCAIYISSS
ncbi:hypothetical protein MATL_G00242990 [Megalops atlanticus]|uniref:Ig-like domain-containing protein n=1 Tax=Megalops atlanticus TaxID=7932 RepID=A0A9D3PCN9_MEGAT|nr:hypothetical protein MATL_G00242990 [Megalops atlanticus]